MLIFSNGSASHSNGYIILANGCAFRSNGLMLTANGYRIFANGHNLRSNGLMLTANTLANASNVFDKVF